MQNSHHDVFRNHMTEITLNNSCHNIEAPEVSLIVPVYNEQEMLPVFHTRTMGVLEGLNAKFEIIYVNDGSRDNSLEIIKEFKNRHSSVGVISFSRNFGKEAAMTAGLHASKGKAVIIIDADLQDPPESIPEMILAWRNGSDMVNMKRTHRNEGPIKRLTAYYFYRVLNKLSDFPIAEDVGDFRLLSRRVVDALNQLPERARFMKGLFSWVGFSQATLEYEKAARFAGESKWKYWKLWNFALEGITSFSTIPLKIASYIGISCALSGFCYAIYVLTKTYFFGDPVHGFPTLMITILIMGGIQLMGMGIIGEYMSRMFTECKRRPLYILESYLPSK